MTLEQFPRRRRDTTARSHGKRGTFDVRVLVVSPSMDLGTFLDGGIARTLTTDTRPTLILKSPESLRRLFLDAAHRGETAAFFGNAQTVLPYLPPDRISDTLLFELSDTRPIGFNPLTDTTMANTVPDAIQLAYPTDGSTPQLDRYVIPAIIALIETGGTLFQLPYLYSSETFRQKVISNVKDKAIWRELMDFEERKKDRQDDQTNSLQNRFTVLKTDRAIRRILSQKKRLTQPGILLVDLPDHARYDLIAILLMATLTGTAFIERPLRHIGDTIPVIGCDYLGQLPDDLKDKMLAEATILATRLGPIDAKELGGHFDVDPGNIHLHQLKDGQALVRTDRTTLVDLIPIDYPRRTSMIRKVRNRSRSQYGTPAEVLDDRTDRFIQGL